MADKIYIFDTTLRDGEQSPGAALNIPQKLEVAKQLERLGVDIIEAGFPMSSPGDFEAVELIAKQVREPVICGLARANYADIDRCWEAIRRAKRSRIHTFIMSSDIQIKHQLHKSKSQVLDMAVACVARAKKYCKDVEFSAMDASRSDWDFLAALFTETIRAGATTINIPDTVGYAYPEEFGGLVKYLMERVKGIEKVIVSAHCHNDLGLATANSLEAVRHGCRQVECTINGLGERAGNTAMEEVVMAFKTRKDFLKYKTDINIGEIYRTSRLVSELTGISVQPNKAVVGSNAFAHESGIHQDGVLKARLTYEIMRPEAIGVGGSKIVLGKHSGRHAFKSRLSALGFKLKEKEFLRAFERFKDLADKKKEVLDEDLIAIVTEEITTVPETYKLDYINITTGNKTVPTATVRLRTDLTAERPAGKKTMQEAACGDGPVDAACQAINRIAGISPKLLDYSLKAVTGGTEALGEVSVRIQNKGEFFTGKASSTDITEASAKAYLAAVNKLVYRAKHKPKTKKTRRSHVTP